MRAPRQRTLARPVTLDGTGLHSGLPASVTFAPAPADTGIRFRRADLEGSAEIPATLDHVQGTERGTTLGVGEAQIRTVEHALAALSAFRVDNVRVDVSGPEVPARDGSFADFVSALDEAGLSEQDADARVVKAGAPLSVRGADGQSYAATPAELFTVSATIAFQHAAIGRQSGSFVIDPDRFRTEVARARTFGFKKDAEALRARGLALGASIENTVVIDEHGVMNAGGLRFDDEFLRHKVGDLVGDLALLGARLQAHVVVERPSHEGNIKFAKAIMEQARQASRETLMDVTRIMEVLPHRYPMLMVDRIVEVVDGERIVGIKNVTINEPFFQGHYPGHPIMPGVLIVEAMAQTGGLLLMDKLDDPEKKVVYFMTMDEVKFRRPVTPGDTLTLEVQLLQARRDVVRMKGHARVDGAVVAEAEFKARIMEK